MLSSEKNLLHLLQAEFPLCERPFACLAAKTGMTEAEVIALVARWQEEGLLRRIGPIFNPAALGFQSTLCAARVPPARLEEAAAKINALQGVTHNYLRDHEFNLWFTLIMPDTQALEQTISALETELEIKILNLPAEHRFKLKAQFPAAGIPIQSNNAGAPEKKGPEAG